MRHLNLHLHFLALVLLAIPGHAEELPLDLSAIDSPYTSTIPRNADEIPPTWLVMPHAVVSHDTTTLISVRNQLAREVVATLQWQDPRTGFVHGIENIALEPRETANRNLGLIDWDWGGNSFGEREGFLRIAALDPVSLEILPNAIFGDFFVVRDGEDFATGDRLMDPESEGCRRPLTRYLEGGAFDGGTTVQLYVPGPYSLPRDEPLVSGDVYDEAGEYFGTILVTTRREAFSIPVEAILEVLDPGRSQISDFGSIEWRATSGAPLVVQVHHEAMGRFSVGATATCLDAAAVD